MMVVSCALVCPGAVTTIVLAVVTTEGGPFWVGVGSGDDGVMVTAADLESELELAFAFEFELLLGFAFELVLELEFELESDVEPEVVLCWLPTLLLSPVSRTDQAFGPPQVSLSYPLQGELH